jgi:hypothetical protein
MIDGNLLLVNRQRFAGGHFQAIGCLEFKNIHPTGMAAPYLLGEYF